MPSLCASCRTPTSDSLCGVCQEPVCRKCRIFLANDQFPLAPELAPELKHTYYCGVCFGEHVEPFEAEYASCVEQAKQINILYRNSKSTLKVIRKAVHWIEISDAVDRDQAIMKLAYTCAKGGYNALIDTEITSHKVRNEGWQTSLWRGRGLPAEIRSYELERS